MESQFGVEVDGAACVLTVDSHGMTLGSGDGAKQELLWPDLQEMAVPSSVSARLNFRGREPLVLRFADREDRDAFRPWAERRGAVVAAAPPSDGAAARPASFAQLHAPAPVNPAIPMHTLPCVPGRDMIESLGLVTAQSVMSRGFFSDTGSDLKSMLGGNLKGMEKAVGDAIRSATMDLSAAAKGLGADAVVAVSVSIAGVGDKAEAIIVVGTAVRTAPAESAH